MNTKDIRHLAQLARLHLNDEQIETYTKQFDEIVEYVDKIKEYSTNEEVAETAIHTTVNVLREDIVHRYEHPETIINEAPDHQENFVKVKKILNQ